MKTLVMLDLSTSTEYRLDLTQELADKLEIPSFNDTWLDIEELFEGLWYIYDIDTSNTAWGIIEQSKVLKLNKKDIETLEEEWFIK